jgi:hypothetical protein
VPTVLKFQRSSRLSHPKTSCPRCAGQTNQSSWLSCPGEWRRRRDRCVPLLLRPLSHVRPQPPRAHRVSPSSIFPFYPTSARTQTSHGCKTLLSKTAKTLPWPLARTPSVLRASPCLRWSRSAPTKALMFSPVHSFRPPTLHRGRRCTDFRLYVDIMTGFAKRHQFAPAANSLSHVPRLDCRVHVGGAHRHGGHGHAGCAALR